MVTARQLDYFVVSYVPNPSMDERYSIGVLAFGRSDNQICYADARFSDDVTALAERDPDVDLDLLRAFFREVKMQFENLGTAEAFLQLMLERFSNMLQVSNGQRISLTGDPKAEVDRLCFMHLDHAGQTRRRKTM